MLLPVTIIQVYFSYKWRCHSKSRGNWWAHLDSNQGPTGYEPGALPAELWAHSFIQIVMLILALLSVKGYPNQEFPQQIKSRKGVVGH